MKIASEIKVLAVALGAFALCGASAQPVLAAANTIPPPPSATATNVTSPAGSTVVNPSPSLAPPPSIQVTSTSTSVPAITTTVTTTTPAIPALPLPIVSDAKPAGNTNNLGALENKVPDTVREVVKHLDKSSTEEVTLDDLNSARQAVAKIEALIDIEKHLAELDKVRQERNKTSFAGAIPASALQPPSSMGMSASGQPMAVPVERLTEVLRIMGRNGSYSAVMKMSDDKNKTVKVGDRLPDGSKVLSITSTQVELERGTIHQSLRVKNVETVFGSSS